MKTHLLFATVHAAMCALCASIYMQDHTFLSAFTCGFAASALLSKLLDIAGDLLVKKLRLKQK